MNEELSNHKSNISILKQDIEFDFIHSSGPGGQNVNKVSSAVLLRFDTNTQAVSEEVRANLKKLYKKRITKDGILMIKSQRYRTQEKNREDAIQRLTILIKNASDKPKLRKKTILPTNSKKKRLEEKRHQSQKKRLRDRIFPED
jgi:ribosome-associated protein